MRHQEVADLVAARLRSALGDGAVSITLFGSVARGEERPDSDVDLLIVARKALAGRARHSGPSARDSYERARRC